MQETPNEKVLDLLTEKQEKQMTKELMKAYSKSLKEVRSQLLKIYEQYADEKGILDYETMQKYNRLANMEATLTNELKVLYDSTGRIYGSFLSEIYTQNYLYTGFILETVSDMKLSYTMLPKEAINKALQNPISGLTLNQRLSKNRTKIIIKVREQLTQGLIQGEGIVKMSERFKNLFEGDTKKALRIAQTETNRVRNQGKQASYDKAQRKGIIFDKAWVAALDSKTRDLHGKLDGEKADKNGYFKIGRYKGQYPGGFGAPEMDINCRCTTRAVFKGYEPTVRRVRGEGIVKYKTYTEWKQENAV